MEKRFQTPMHSAYSAYNEVRLNMAAALVGRTVGLCDGKKTITHGVVSAVLNEAGMPKLVVDGMRYEVSHIFTVTPTTLN